MKRRDMLFIIFVVLAGLLFFSFNYYHQSKINYFYSLDPFFHYYLSEEIVDKGFDIKHLEWCVDDYSVQYPSLLRIFLSFLSLIFGNGLVFLYKYSGSVFTFGAIIFLSLGIRRLVDKTSAALLTFFLAVSLTYVMWRSLITYPENMALFMMAGLFYSFTIRDMYLNGLFFLALSYIHLPSFFICLLYTSPSPRDS